MAILLIFLLELEYVSKSVQHTLLSSVMLMEVSISALMYAPQELLGTKPGIVFAEKLVLPRIMPKTMTCAAVSCVAMLQHSGFIKPALITRIPALIAMIETA